MCHNDARFFAISRYAPANHVIICSTITTFKLKENHLVVCGFKMNGMQHVWNSNEAYIILFQYPSIFPWICSNQANSPQPSRVLSTAPASMPMAYSTRMHGTRILKRALARHTVTSHRPMRCAWAFVTPRRTHAETHNRPSRLNTHATTQAAFQYISPTHEIHLCPACHFDLGGSRHGWGLLLEQTNNLTNQSSMLWPLCFTLNKGQLFFSLKATKDFECLTITSSLICFEWRVAMTPHFLLKNVMFFSTIASLKRKKSFMLFQNKNYGSRNPLNRPTSLPSLLILKTSCRLSSPLLLIVVVFFS